MDSDRIESNRQYLEIGSVPLRKQNKNKNSLNIFV